MIAKAGILLLTLLYCTPFSKQRQPVFQRVERQTCWL
jgi:hypothetical protein